jgi:SAM-dependent methyltransferase
VLTNLFFLILIFILLTALYASLSAAPWLPTKKREAARMIELAGLKAGDVVYDLGCGDGRLLIKAAQTAPKIKVVGIEISLVLYLIAKLSLFFKKINGKVIFKNIFKTNLAEASVIFIFLLPKCYERLKNKLERELEPGSRVVVGVWPIKGWEDKLIKADKPTEKDLSIFLYKI